MPKIKMLTSVAGSVAGHDSPAIGEVIEVSEADAKQWADGERAERVQPEKEGRITSEKRPAGAPESASMAEPERAMKPSPAPRRRSSRG